MMTAENRNDPVIASSAAGRAHGKIDLLSSPSTTKTKAVEILTSPRIMADFFRTGLAEIFPKGLILKECKPQVLRDRQHRRQVILYQLIFSHPSARKTLSTVLVAKRFADRAKGWHEYLAMRMLWEKGFDHRSDLRIPRPFYFFNDFNLLIEERAQGTLLRKSLTSRSPAALNGLKTAARWLIKLHGVEADHEAIGLHADDKTSIKGWVRGISGREPKLLPKLEEVGSLVGQMSSFFKKPRLALVHGDFHYDNIFVEKKKATVIDFGRFCKSDPARDLGYMIAQARTISLLETGSFAPVSPGLNAFWEEYLSTLSYAEREAFSHRTSLFTAVKYLENINYISSFSPQGRKDVWHSLLNDAKRFAKVERVEAMLTERE